MKSARRNEERPVSLAPLDVKKALAGLLAIPDPAATKPKNKKTPPKPNKA